MSPEEAHAAAIEAAVNVWRLRDTEPADWITTYLASLRASGYVVVPGKPTEEMEDAAGVLVCPAIENGADDWTVCGLVWQAMVSAAPAFPPTSPDA